MELPYNGRATIEITPGYAEISIPPKRNIFILIFATIWVSFWFLGGLFAIGAAIFDSEDMPFFVPLIFLVFWSFPIILIGRILWWFLFGKEIIAVQKDALSVFKKGLLFSKPKSYYITECKGFRVSDNTVMQMFPFGFRPLFFGGNSSGIIVFDYGMQTIKIADGIDEAEGKHILRLLKEQGFLTDNNF